MATIKISIHEARNLPVMDRASNLADPYVVVKLDDNFEQTEICPKTLNPVWNRDFRFDVPDLQTLQEDPIELRIYDHDRFSRDDLIGTLFVDLNCLLPLDDPAMEAWFPIVDVVWGHRGDIRLGIKLKFHAARNPFVPMFPTRSARGLSLPPTHQSHSLTRETEGVLFFSVSRLDPLVYRIEHVYPMVEELLVKEDPEQSWTLRSNRSTYEARVLQLFKLSGKVRRQLGKRAIELGCNCVLGYHESFDFESLNGILVRAYGTPCAISVVEEALCGPASMQQTPSAAKSKHAKSLYYSPEALRAATNHAAQHLPPLSDTEGEVHPYDEPSPLADITRLTRSRVILLPVRTLPAGALLGIGGCVAARSVKIVSKHRTKASIQQERDAWWNELREELKSNARTFGCNAVISYEEDTFYYEDIVLLSVTGTAVVVDETWWSLKLSPEDMFYHLKREQVHQKLCTLTHMLAAGSQGDTDDVHLCGICHRKEVPEVLLITCDVPNETIVESLPKLLEVRVLKAKPSNRGVELAQVVSQALPYIEYTLHRQLLFKLKLWGLNAAAHVKVSIRISDTLILGTCTATGYRVAGLPVPEPPQMEFTPLVAASSVSAYLQAALAKMNAYIMGKQDRVVATATPTTNGTSMNGSLVNIPEGVANALLAKLPPFGLEAGTLESSAAQCLREDTEETTLPTGRSDDSDSMRRNYVIQIDDMEEAEAMAGIFEGDADGDCSFLSVPYLHTEPNMWEAETLVAVQRRYTIGENPTTELFSKCTGDCRRALLLKLAQSASRPPRHCRKGAVAVHSPVILLNYQNDTNFTTNGDLHIRISGMLCRLRAPDSVQKQLEDRAFSTMYTGGFGDGDATAKTPHQTASPKRSPKHVATDLRDKTSSQDVNCDEVRCKGEDIGDSVSSNDVAPRVSMHATATDSKSFEDLGARFAVRALFMAANAPFTMPYVVNRNIKMHADNPLIYLQDHTVPISCLPFVPGCAIVRYMSRLSHHFIREERSVDDNEGLGNFLSKMMFEAHSILTTLVLALGGNALIDRQVIIHEMEDTDGSKEAYVFVSITGQVVLVSSEPLLGSAPTSTSESLTNHRNSASSAADVTALAAPEVYARRHSTPQPPTSLPKKRDATPAPPSDTAARNAPVALTDDAKSACASEANVPPPDVQSDTQCPQRVDSPQPTTLDT